MTPPHEFIYVNGILTMNPAYKAWKDGQVAQTTGVVPVAAAMPTNVPTMTRTINETDCDFDYDDDDDDDEIEEEEIPVPDDDDDDDDEAEKDFACCNSNGCAAKRRLSHQECLARDQVMVTNTSSVRGQIILAYAKCDIQVHANFLLGVSAGPANANVDVGCQKRVKEPEPQTFSLEPGDSVILSVERGTEKVYLTVIVPNGNTSRVPQRNILWPLPKQKSKFRRSLTKKQHREQKHRGNRFQLFENDMKGGYKIGLDLQDTRPLQKRGFLSFFGQ